MPEKPTDGKYKQADPGEWVEISGWGEFTRHFGGFQQQNELLAHAVYGYFLNGGARCYVARLPAFDVNQVGTALEDLAGIAGVDLVAAPMELSDQDELDGLHTAILAHCAGVSNRFAILDCLMPTTATKADDVKPPAQKQGFGAYYFPWIEVPDFFENKGRKKIPPSGYVAGMYVRTDRQRGVFKAPANEQLAGVLGLNRTVSDALNGSLNDKGVNCIRNFGGAILAWGGRTLAANGGDAEWKYVSVRRYMIFLQESLTDSLRWAVFEPNTPALWNSIVRSVSGFLLQQWQDGALFGAKPENAFFVQCDAETNPEDRRELGVVMTRIGVAVAKPSEFVVFEIEQLTGS